LLAEGAYALRKLLISAAALAMACTPASVAQEGIGAEDRAAARALLEELVSYRTAKGYGEVPAMIDAIEGKLKAAGFQSNDIIRLPKVIDGEETMGLIVRYRGTNEELPPVLLLGHMDVVDAEPGNWETPPFEAVEKDGYLYGRGTIDNKAGVSLVLASFIRLKEDGWQPERELMIAFSGDEETGMQTTRLLANHPLVQRAEFALNSDAGVGVMTAEGEPVAFFMQSAEKTYADIRLTVTNKGGHSATPRPDNAVYDLARAVTAIEETRFPVSFNEITRGTAERLAAEEGGEFGAALMRLLEDPADAEARAIVEKRPEHSNMMQTTCVATMLDAGHAPNALPQNAHAVVNCRILPGTKVDDVLATLEEAIGNDAVSMTLMREAVESPVSPPRDDVVAALQRAIDANYEGVTVRPTMSSGGTDGREFRSAGIPTYGAGSLAIVQPEDGRAHGRNERLPLVSYEKELLFWDTLLKDIGG
jgi:carboxypeptidase PM20D1